MALRNGLVEPFIKYRGPLMEGNPSKLNFKGVIFIYKISKEESMEIRKRFPYVCITITNRQSSHKHYYVEETRGVRNFLETERGVSLGD